MLRALVTYGILPVVSSVAQGPAGTLLNVNADAAAAAIAAALGASELRFITDVEGLLDGEGRLVEHLTRNEADRYLESEVVSGGMRPKLQAALSALGAGVQSIHIGTETGGTSLVAA